MLFMLLCEAKRGEERRRGEWAREGGERVSVGIKSWKRENEEKHKLYVQQHLKCH